MFVFYTTHCPKCRLLEMRLKESGESYETIDLNEDTATLDDLIAKGFASAPLLKTPEGDILNFKDALIALKGRENGRQGA